MIITSTIFGLKFENVYDDHFLKKFATTPNLTFSTMFYRSGRKLSSSSHTDTAQLIDIARNLVIHQNFVTVVNLI